MAQRKKSVKPSESFAGKAAKQVNPTEEAVAALLPVWAAPQDRKKLFWDSGFNDDLQMTDDCYKEWMSNRLAREALSVDMNASIDTRFAFGIFSAGHGTAAKDQTHIYILAHRGNAIATGPGEISDKLRQELEAAGMQYVAQTDKGKAASAINDFLARGAVENYNLGLRQYSPGEQVEILIHAFCACEAPADRFLSKVGPDEYTIVRGATVGALLAEAGRPENVMHTVDLDKLAVPQKNHMHMEGQPLRYPEPQAKHPDALQPAPKAPVPKPAGAA